MGVLKITRWSPHFFIWPLTEPKKNLICMAKIDFKAGWVWVFSLKSRFKVLTLVVEHKPKVSASFLLQSEKGWEVLALAVSMGKIDLKAGSG